MVHFQVFLRCAYIDPVISGYKRQDRFLMFKQRGKQATFKGVGLTFRHVLQNRRLENVDTGVDRVAGNLIGSRLFDESLNPSVWIRFNEPVSGGVLNWCQ